MRSLYSAESEARVLEERIGREATTTFPIQGDMWHRVAQMCLDSTTDVPLEEKWLMGAGFDPVWNRVTNAP
jgi:hypothetical protein